MIERTITTAGCVTYWQLPGTADLSMIRAAFTSCGLGSLAPEQPTDAAALRNALSECYGGSDILVRPIKGGGGYNVVRETRAGTKNRYEVRYSAQLTAGGVSVEPFDYSDPERETERVTEEMNLQRTRVSRTALATALAAAVPALGGITLRDSGGVYYLPPQAESLWERLAIELEACCGVVVYRLRTGHGETELRAIRDAAIAELTAEAERIREECCVGIETMRESTAIARRNQLGTLRDRMEIYRNVLGEGLAQIASAIDHADQTAGAVQLAASARLARERKAARV